MTHRKRKHHKKTLFSKYPKWAWWIGGIGIVAVYIWVFYYFFVGPFGFRWRALMEMPIIPAVMKSVELTFPIIKVK